MPTETHIVRDFDNDRETESTPAYSIDPPQAVVDQNGQGWVFLSEPEPLPFRTLVYDGPIRKPDGK